MKTPNHPAQAAAVVSLDCLRHWQRRHEEQAAAEDRENFLAWCMTVPEVQISIA
jgi:hypothetical protein